MIRSPSIVTKALTALMFAGLVAAFAGQPATAQTAKKLKCTGCVKGKQLKKNAVTGPKVRDGSIGGADLAGGAVTQDKLGADVAESLQKGSRAAGQSCSAGDVVTGFDAGGNIICSGGGGSGGLTLALQNDSFVPGGAVSAQQGFIVGEEAAATLGPIASTGTLDRVQLFLGVIGAPAATNVTLKIYQEVGTTDPGPEIFSDTFVLNPSNTSLQDIDLSADNVVVNGGSTIRVSIQFDVIPGGVGPAHDVGSVVPDRSWINADGFGWTSAASLGVGGNWIVRATVAPL